jgi:hypothetical protein
MRTLSIPSLVLNYEQDRLESVGIEGELYRRDTPLIAENTVLKSENAKLRGLIADVHEALCADKAGMFHRLTLASMEDDMRELGMEVDG